MSFDWSDYLRVARHLQAEAARTDFADAMQRSAISRAYYAAYHAASELFVQCGGVFLRGKDSHESVISHLAQQPAKDLRLAGADLKDLKILRINADYKVRWGGAGVNHNRAINLSGRIIKRLASNAAGQD